VRLTTHYLEEAEALCGRIAMLKQGRVVALDSTAALLSRASASVLCFKTDNELPEVIRSAARITGRMVQLPAARAADVESWLARLRECGVAVEDVEIRRPDLEDVFLQVMEAHS
jgi:ABC-2 type transport system ATP-binding protein